MPDDTINLGATSTDSSSSISAQALAIQSLTQPGATPSTYVPPSSASQTIQDFINGLTDFYGTDPFAGPSTPRRPTGKGKGGSNPDDPDVGGDVAGPLSGVDPIFVRDLVSVLASAKTPNGDDYVWTKDDLTRLAQQLWANPEVQTTWPLLGASGLTARLKDELSSSGIIGARTAGSGHRLNAGYPDLATELADMTPLARQRYYEEQDRKQHGAIYSLYQQYFGRAPTLAEVAAVAAHGTDPQQWTDYVRSMKSHVGGMNVGQYFDLRSLADKQSQAIYGHDSNDDLVKQMFDRGLANKEGVGFFYDQLPLQPGKNIDPIVYNALYAGAEAHTKAIWNQEPDPVHLAATWQQNGSPGSIAPTDAAQVAATGAGAPAAAAPPSVAA